MKNFKALVFFALLTNSLSLVAMDQVYDLFHLKAKKPQVSSPAAISLLKLSAIEKACDDAEYFKEHYLETKNELTKYKAAWTTRKDSIMPKLGTYSIGCLQSLLGSICFYEVYQLLRGEQKISENKVNFYCVVMLCAGLHQWQKAYKKFKELYQWESVARREIDNTKNALINLDKYKAAPALR